MEQTTRTADQHILMQFELIDSNKDAKMKKRRGRMNKPVMITAPKLLAHTHFAS